MKSLVYVEAGKEEYSLDLLAVINRIYDGGQVASYAVSTQSQTDKLEGAFDYLIQSHLTQDQAQDPMVVSALLSELYDQYQFDSILILSSHFGRMLAPRLSMRIHAGLVADITDVKQVDGQVELVRPAFSGHVLAGITCRDTGPMMMTVRENIFHWHQVGKKDTQVICYHMKQVLKSQLRVVEVKEKKVDYDIQKSDVLISGGGGVVKAFDSLTPLADALGGHVSASRKIIDQGLASRAIQVGQSGKTVSPDLYLALGINGAIQHVEGLNKVKHMIAVNINPKAPICSLADIVVKGNAVTFIELLMEKIEKEK